MPIDGTIEAIAKNLCLVGPRAGKSHFLLALGHAAVTEGHKVGYFAAADPRRRPRPQIVLAFRRA